MMNLPPAITTALDIIEKNGYEAYLVGGCVRDMLMGTNPHDYDIAANALPEQLKDIFSGYTIIETGLKHGTVTVVISGENIEITTYRVDGEYTDNRRPESVTFTSSLPEDLSRRDFTINAMAYSPRKGVVDLYGGTHDIKMRIVRCVGDPDRRFGEDGLRIMRALRFASVLNFSIDDETSKSIFRCKSLLKGISAERLISEFSQLVCGSGAAGIIRKYVDVIGEFIPELIPMTRCDQNTKYHCYNVFEHTLHTLEYTPPKKNLRLAALFHDVAKPLCKVTDSEGRDHFKGHQPLSRDIAVSVLKRLKADRRTVKQVSELVRLHDEKLKADKIYLRKMLSEYSCEFLIDLLSLQRADSLAHAQEYRGFAYEYDKIKDMLLEVFDTEGRITLKALKIKGSDIIALGVDDGAEIGKILNEIHAAVLSGETDNNRQALLAKAENIVNNITKD